LSSSLLSGGDLSEKARQVNGVPSRNLSLESYNISLDGGELRGEVREGRDKRVDRSGQGRNGCGKGILL
jgi:hypothetical protein